MNRQKYRKLFAQICVVYVIVFVAIGCTPSSIRLNAQIPTSTPTIISTMTPSLTPTHTPTLMPTPFGGGGQFVFSQQLNGDQDIYIMNVDRSGLTNLTNSPGYDGQPKWSPDSDRILFISERTGNFDIYVMNADGTEVVNLTNSPLVEFSPAWSPDGNQIAYSSGSSILSQEIYIMNSDGTEIKKLTKQPSLTYGLDWSPDGTKIVFDAGRTDSMFRWDHMDIFVINTDGTGLTRITNDEPDDIWPRWSPDGTRISFVRSGSEKDRSGNYGRENFIINSDGSGMVRFLAGAGVTRGQTTWSPDGTKIAMFGGVEISIYVLNADLTCCIRTISLPLNFNGYGSVDWSPK